MTWVMLLPVNGGRPVSIAYITLPNAYRSVRGVMPESHLYRIHPDSYTRVASGYTEVIGARLKYLDWVEEYLRQEGISDVQVDKALRRAQLPLRHPRLHWLLDSTRRRKLVVAGGRKVGRVLIPLPLRDMLRQRWRNYVRPPEIDRSIDD